MTEEIKTAALFNLETRAYGEFLAAFDMPWDNLREIGALARERLRGAREGEIMAGAHVGDDVDIGPGTVVEPGAVINGPTVIGANCEVRAGAYIRGDAVIADGCIVGNSSEIKNALMLEGSHAPHFNYVGDSILGQRANLGAGVKLSNWKVAAAKNVKIAVGGEIIDTGLDKFGAILGDDVEIGCNTVTNPGTVVGPRTIIYAVSNVRGFIPADSVVKLRQPQDFVPRRGV